MDLRGTVLTNVVIDFAHVCKPILDDKGVIVDAVGQFQDILALMRSHMNFTNRLVLPVDGKWGALEPDGTWNGMVGMLVRGEADLITTALSMTRERASALDYSHGLDEDIVTMSMVVSRINAMNFWAYVDIFHQISWTVMSTVAVLLALSFAVIKATGMETFHPVGDSEDFTVLNAFALIAITSSSEITSSSPSLPPPRSSSTPRASRTSSSSPFTQRC